MDAYSNDVHSNASAGPPCAFAAFAGNPFVPGNALKAWTALESADGTDPGNAVPSTVHGNYAVGNAAGN